jgi:hypothetical protein
MLQDLSVFILIIEHVADLCAALRIKRNKLYPSFSANQ